MNQYAEAFKEPMNAVGLATMAAISFATFNPLPLLAAVVAEAAYLLMVPDSRFYRDRLARRGDAETQRRWQKLKEETLATLDPDMHARYQRLEEVRAQIDRQTEAQEDKEWFREVVRKLDYLLEKFLLFAGKEIQFQSYLDSLRAEVGGTFAQNRNRIEESTRAYEVRDKRGGGKRNGFSGKPADRGGFGGPSSAKAEGWVKETVAQVQRHYETERQELETALAAEPDEDTKAVLQKRIDVLQRRHEFAGKIGRILTNVNHQLDLVEDTFGLINDEIRARSPEQILADIEEVVVATDSMSSALEEMAPYEQLVARAVG